MATRSPVLPENVPVRAAFYVVRHDSSAPGIITVSHAVPPGAEKLGSFDTPSLAIDFAEAIVHELNQAGSAVEMVDPPHGIVGAG